MPLLEIERKILDAIVMRFLQSKEPSLRKPLVLQFEDVDAIDHLCQLQLLRVSEGNTYLPPALAFHYCENEEAEALSRRSLQTVAHVLKKLYPEDHPNLTTDALVKEAKNFYEGADAEMIRLGLYLAPEFGILNGWSGGNFQQLDISPMGISERIMKLKNIDTLWDDYVTTHIPWPVQDSFGGVVPPGTIIVDQEEISTTRSWPELDNKDSRRVFLVHGHDEAVKLTVARFLERLGLAVIILHEQPNKGRTVIEKFEAHSDVGFAVVLLTPDDEGYSTKSPEILKKRARQNVILELGYFIGKLGRQRVCALYVEGVEIPSDINGVLYVRYEAGDGWQNALAKEIKAAGIRIDLNRSI
ncbi:MAG TPA: nucleotide-binding protein [Candidatus Dormibacteraeota bacterium]|nr:nucleotide-binding protein [Candidatus Dormibacteraeota bacterium]